MNKPIRRTMRVGDIRTSVKLEQLFWDALVKIAKVREVRLTKLVNEVNDDRASWDADNKFNLSSALRVFALRDVACRLANLEARVRILNEAQAHRQQVIEGMVKAGGKVVKPKIDYNDDH